MKDKLHSYGKIYRNKNVKRTVFQNVDRFSHSGDTAFYESRFVGKIGNRKRNAIESQNQPIFAVYFNLFCLILFSIDSDSAWRESKLFSCPHCLRTYSMEKNMRRHMKLECGKQATQQCPFCPHKTKRKDQLKKHIQVKHLVFL